ncbi:hypothetical protein C0J52_10172 [Blattella germanica]|nr:hypothetical protein C0J52_10172 [Blattella germanica]
MDGKFLVLPMRGTGKAKMEFSDNTNKVLNENWKAFWEELRPSFEETFGAIFSQLAKKVFDKVPSQEIFLD